MLRDQTYDKQIQELLQIKLGLQQRSQKIFKQLLDQKQEDPLNNMIGSMIKRNETIRQLKQQVRKLQKQNVELKNTGVIGNSRGGIPLKLSDSKNQNTNNNQRSRSLPDDHSKAMKAIEQKKQMVMKLRNNYNQKTSKFIVFLIKCLRDISQSKYQKSEDLQALIKKLQNDLNNFEKKIFQLEQQRQKSQGKGGQNKSFSQKDTSYTKKQINKKQTEFLKQRADQNLHKLVKQIKQSKDHEKIFEKIHANLGLKQIWDTYIQSLKQQSSMYWQTKQLYFTPQIFNRQKINVPKDKTILQVQQQLFKQLMKERGSKSQWAQIYHHQIQKARQYTSKESNRNFVNQLVDEARKQLASSGLKIYQLIVNTIQYFFDKLDKMFIKHNQNPYKMCERKNYNNFRQKIKQVVLNSQWKQAFQTVQQQIDETFYFIQRRTKFYSCNRVVIRGTRLN